LQALSAGLGQEVPATAEPAPPQLVFGRDKVILYWAELLWSRLTGETEDGAFQPARAVGIVWSGDVIGTCRSMLGLSRDQSRSS
jgi:hypothetical protein